MPLRRTSLIATGVLTLTVALMISASTTGAATTAPAQAAGGAYPMGSETAPDSRAARPGEVLYSQSAVLTGDDQPSEPGHRLTRVRVDISVGETRDHVSATLTTAAPRPGALLDDQVTIGLGHLSDNTCRVSNVEWSYLFDGQTVHTIVGNSPGDFGARPAAPWNCVLALVEPRAGGSPHDVLIGPLTDHYERPQLKVGKVELLDRKQPRLKLVRKTWTGIDVTVTNTGKVAARHLVLTGNGKRLKVKKARLGKLAAGESATLRIRVKPTARQAGRLRLRLNAPGAAAARRIKVKAVKAPPRPRPGSYRSKDGSVRFTVRKGRIVGFRVATRTRCGSPGTIATYTNSTYTLPRVKVPRNGIVEVQQTGTAGGWDWRASGQLRIGRKKATQGRFNYFNGAGWCSASETFTARRVGR